MAKIEPMRLVNFKSVFQTTNISDIVGIGKKNEKNDVMLIQALFKLVGYDDVVAKRILGSGLTNIPDVTGALDEKTIKMIWGFQRHNANHLLNIDGKIHPASYQDRVIKEPTGRLMAITYLNNLAIDGAFINFSTGDVISVIKQIAPSIVFV